MVDIQYAIAETEQGKKKERKKKKYRNNRGKI